MPMWGRTDNVSNSVIWAAGLLNKAPTRANSNTLFGNTTAGGFITGRTDSMVAADDSEAVANPVAHAGWQLRTVGSGGRAGRVTYETLAVVSSMTGDADANTLLNFLIFISTQPVDTEIADGANGTFDVVTYTVPDGETVTYQWQIDASANGTWANIADSGFYSNSTTASLFIEAANDTIDGALFRVVASGANTSDVTSDEVTLTITA